MPKRQQLDRRGYSLSPQMVDRHFWYYEEPKGLCCIFQPRDKNSNLLFAWPAWRIPWRTLERTMKRREAAKRKRKRKLED